MALEDLFQDDVREKRGQRVRLTVSVPASALEIYRRMAEISGSSVGRTIGDWLSDTAEAAEAVNEIQMKAKAAPLIAAAEVHAAAVKANSVTWDLLKSLSDSVSNPQRGPHLGDAAGSTSESSEDGLTPPYSNTGGKGSKTRRKGH